MTRAADILKQRAQMSEEHIAAYGICSPDELRAVAELMNACAPASNRRCLICAGWDGEHAGHCRLAALERAITVENK